MNTIRRSHKLLALAAASTLVIAACGSDDNSSSSDTTAGTTADSTATAPADTTAGTTADTTAGTTGDTTTGTGGEPAGDVAMTVTYDINPDAVWDDGTPITFADFKCLADATLNTPGSLSTVGYDKIVSMEQGDSDKQVVVGFSEVYAPYKNLFRGLIKADAMPDCNDVSAEMADILPFSGTEWKMDSWSLDQVVLSPNEAFWDDSKTPIAKSVVMVPRTDDGGVASLLSGESDFIFPQAYAGITDALNDPNVDFEPGYGTNYEGLYFQQKDGPFADPDFRAAFSQSIDRDLILKNVYDPIFPGAPLLNCGLWVPTIGPWCDNSAFGNEDGTDANYDPEGAAKILTDAGWEKDGSGMWAKDGTVPEIRWMVNSGNTRRESAQALLIPELAAAGFNVIADNCDAACVFQQRLPALDYDLGMYINTASPDPEVTSIMACDSVPSDANGNQGQNSTGWCNEEASATMTKADQTLDEGARADLVHQIAGFLRTDSVMLPLFQFPNIAAWRTDTLSGPIAQDAGNYQAFQNLFAWTKTGGDSIVIGAEQWPECLNPITECANSSWYQWSTAFKVLPNAFDTTSEGTYVVGSVLAGEPEVVVS